ncbi:hypothetical protein, partial [Klebsiella pneumoniae]|uniref:hypothetical protein n=1 Tax=Klebsiella pneumoniae TaxID=573 RepID=UPI003013FC38
MADSVGGGENPPQHQSDAASYCAKLGMRLPTETEALALAMVCGDGNCACPPFGSWGTWTSTAVPGMSGYAYT